MRRVLWLDKGNLELLGTGKIDLGFAEGLAWIEGLVGWKAPSDDDEKNLRGWWRKLKSLQKILVILGIDEFGTYFPSIMSVVTTSAPAYCWNCLSPPYQLALGFNLGLFGYSHGQVIQQLLQRGADVNIQEGDYDSALQMASYQGHIRVVRRPIEKEAGVNIPGGEYGSALYMVSYRGHNQIVNWLLEKEADVNLQGVQ
jgi:hypothetical protein